MIIYCSSYAHDIMIWITRSSDLHSDNIITTTRQISTPTKSISLNRSKKIQHNWLRPRGDFLYQIWYKSTHWGILGKWVKY